MTTAGSAVEALRRTLLEEMDSGTLAAGTRLGSERELATRYGVSRGTLRQVLATLESAGLIRRVPGRGGGTFVSHPKVERDLAEVHSLPRLLARQGYDAGTRVISTLMTTPSDRVRTALALEEESLIVTVTRLRLADGRPMSLDQAFFPVDRFPGLLEKPLGGSLYELLAREYGVEPDDAEEVIEVVHATDKEAAMLSISVDAPLLLVRRVTRDTDGRPFEYSKDLFRSDRTKIRMRTPARDIRRTTDDDSNVVELWRGEESWTG
ncbi:GntR family transcriptional regulator [Janibacter corallicola]|uniref:GntR family transcriptional regulator n=1 Tax=Janibacter corallicola TaxID=415212 RepID=UPI000A857BC4|nr:GntR family transcriptional regulator [Janibacter corallicola]